MGSECRACENVKDQTGRFQKFQGPNGTPLQIGEKEPEKRSTPVVLHKNSYFQREQLTKEREPGGDEVVKELVHF